MGSCICKIEDLGELIKNMKRLAEGTQGTFHYKPGVISKLKEYPRIKWYYYNDNRQGNTIRLYDSEFYNEFSQLYKEPKAYVILRGHDLGTPDGTLKQKIRDLFESIKKPPPGINTKHREVCLSYFEERDKVRMQQRYKALKEKVIERKKDFDAFIKMLETETSWLTSPASSRFHLSKEKGLLKHSISVAENLIKLHDLLAPEIPDESCVIVGLFHDVGKVGMPGKPYYLPNPNQEQVKSRGFRYIVNSDLVHIDLPTRSLYLVAKYIPLNENEIQAIRYHDGQYIPENRSVAHRETYLTRLLQYADNWTGCVHEEER